MDAIPTLEENNNTAGNSKEEKSAFQSFVHDEQKETSSTTGEVTSGLVQATEDLPGELTDTLFFEITYLEDPQTKKSGTAYSETVPLFSEDGKVKVSNAFGCLILKETVLGRQVVERKCKKVLDEEDLIINSKNGLLIKAILPQTWMFQNEQETKSEFDKAVLDTFREVQAVVAKELRDAEITKAKAEQAQQSIPSRQQQQENTGQRPRNTYIQDDEEFHNINHDPRRRKVARQQARPIDSDELQGLD